MSDEKFYKTVLIADDCEPEIQKLKDHFSKNKVEVIYVDNPADAFEVIEEKKIDLLILDWFFNQPLSNEYALQVLEALIFNKYYIPVFIYSNNIEEQDISSESFEGYPKILINSMKKLNPSQPEEVQSRIDSWFESNPAVKLARLWYDSVSDAVGKTLGEIYDKMGTGVIGLLNQSYATDSDKDKGASNIIDLIMEILHNNLLMENNLISQLNEIITKSLDAPQGEDYNYYELLRSIEMYCEINDNVPIETGDIFLLSGEFLGEKGEKRKLKPKDGFSGFAVNITGECDYANKKNLKYHKLILGDELVCACKLEKDVSSFIDRLSTHNIESKYYLPFINSEKLDKDMCHIVLDFQNVISVEKSVYDKILIKNRIGRLRTVYYQHLLRRYSSFSSRIGVPNIPKNKKQQIVDLIKKNIEEEKSANEQSAAAINE